MDRTFRAKDRHGAEFDFELKEASSAEEHEADRQYKIAYNKAIVDGIFPREKLREVMKGYGIWTEKDEEDLKKTLTQLAIYEVELDSAEKAGKKEECLKIAGKMREERSKMFQLFSIQQSVFMNSAENIADAIRVESLMAACVIIKASRQRYWKNYSDYVTERDYNEESEVYSKAVEVQSKLMDSVRDEIVNSYPEMRYFNQSLEEVQAEAAVIAKENIEKRKEDAKAKVQDEEAGT